MLRLVVDRSLSANSDLSKGLKGVPRGGKYTSREVLPNGKIRYHYGDEHTGNIGHPKRIVSHVRRAGFESVDEAIQAHHASHDPNLSPDSRMRSLHPDARAHIDKHRPQTLDRSDPELDAWYAALGHAGDAAPVVRAATPAAAAPEPAHEPPRSADINQEDPAIADWLAELGLAKSRVGAFLQKAHKPGAWRTSVAPTTSFAEYDRSGRFSPIRYVAIGKLRPTQSAIVEEKVARLVKLLRDDPTKLPPVVVERIPDIAAFDVLDGHHRVEAARRAGITTIPVVVYTMLRTSHGQQLVVKAHKGEVIAGHKYDSRKWDATKARWLYTYQGQHAGAPLDADASSDADAAAQRRALFKERLQEHKKEVEHERQLALIDFDDIALKRAIGKTDIDLDDITRAVERKVVDYTGTTFVQIPDYTPRPAPGMPRGVPPIMSLAQAQTFEQALGLIEKSIRKLPYEVGHWIDAATGEVRYSKRGKKGSVPFTAQDTALVNDNVFTHNHPEGGSFSANDIWCLLQYQMRELRAVGQKYRYVMRLPDDAHQQGWRFGTTKNATVELLLKRITVLHKRHEAAIGATREERVARGEISYREATEDFWHDVWTAVFADMGWSEYYKREQWEDGATSEWGAARRDRSETDDERMQREHRFEMFLREQRQRQQQGQQQFAVGAHDVEE